MKNIFKYLLDIILVVAIIYIYILIFTGYFEYPKMKHTNKIMIVKHNGKIDTCIIKNE
jgi:hypothetical protein